MKSEINATAVADEINAMRRIVDAMRRIVVAMDRLDVAAQARVAGWLFDRYVPRGEETPE